MRNFNNLSLRTKSTLISLVISIIPLTIVGYVANLAIRQALVHAANESLSGAAAQTAANLDGFIQANLDTIRTEAQIPDFATFLTLSGEQRVVNSYSGNPDTEMPVILHALSRRDQLYILSYALLDKNGIIVIGTDANDIGVDQSQHDYFREPVTTGLPYVSSVEFPGMGSPPSLYFSAPIRDAAGEIVGVLRLRYSAAVLQQIVAGTNGLAGNQSFAVLLDENHLRLADGPAPDLVGMMVVPLEPAKVVELRSRLRLPQKPLDQLSTDLIDFEQGLTNAAARPFFRAELRPSETIQDAVAVAPMTTEPWLVAFAQSEAEYLAPVEAQTRSLWLVGSLMIALIALTVAGATRLVTGPILRLTAVAEKAGTGDLDIQARVEADDEIGKLAKTFNAMTRQLGQTLNGLAESEARYHGLFEDSAISLWEEDFSAVKARLEALHQQGVVDFGAFLQSHPEVVTECAALTKITDVNAATLRLYRARSKAELLQNLEQIFLPESYGAFVEQLVNIAEGRSEFEYESVNQTLAGERLDVSLHLSAVRGYEDTLSKVIVSLIDITERKQAEEKLRHDAYHDMLTGLPNRLYLLDRLRQALERARRHPDYTFAVLFLDFDRFKLINDSLGHTIGDQLLIAIAKRLTLGLRALDMVARLGGDEFVILLEDIRELAEATYVANRIQAEVAKPFSLSEYEVFSSASIGIVLSNLAYERPDELLRDADAAMYQAKALGKARYEVFHPDLRQRAVARQKLESDLRRAVEQHEFRVHYQPIVSLATRKVTGFEALLRWQHPEQGLLLPMDFLAAAEETGMILPIGLWLLQEVCYQLKSWQIQYPADPPLTVSVNLSSQQFRQLELNQHIKRLLDDTGLIASSLKLEITERTIIEDTDSAANMLARLKALGVQLEIDDFGTGYSSLSYLHRLDLDALKIDQSFVQRLGSPGSHTAIIRTIITLGQQLGLQLVAEGVETEDQLDKLKGLGCQNGQGYLFGKPMASEDVMNHLATGWQVA